MTDDDLSSLVKTFSMTNKQSPAGQLNSIDLKKIGIGALVAVVGALLTYISQEITQIDFGEYTPVVVAMWSIFANVVRKLLQGN